jgi:hypothetical protein
MRLHILRICPIHDEMYPSCNSLRRKELRKPSILLSEGDRTLITEGPGRSVAIRYVQFRQKMRAIHGAAFVSTNSSEKKSPLWGP